MTSSAPTGTGGPVNEVRLLLTSLSSMPIRSCSCFSSTAAASAPARGPGRTTPGNPGTAPGTPVLRPAGGGGNPACAALSAFMA
eukprot:9109898-Pyramimonas_sp.AAC.1